MYGKQNTIIMKKTKKVNNAFKYETIKKQCENLLEVYDEETHKQYKIILESNNKIDNANIYNLDGFKKYNVF